MLKNLRVAIVEDHDVVREGLKLLISSDPAMQIAGEANTGQSAVQMAVKLKPDVIVMDLAMPQGSGLDAARQIRKAAPECRVLVLSAYRDLETIERVIKSGAAGYVTKHSAASDLLQAIRDVSVGGVYYSREVADKLKARQQFLFRAGRSSPTRRLLTGREEQVLVSIASGQPNKEIAYNLGISIKTVEKHRQAAMDKLNIHDTAGLTRYAISRGLLGANAGLAAGTGVSLPLPN